MHIIYNIFTVDADLLMPILQWTRTFEPAFLNKKSKTKRLINAQNEHFLYSFNFRFQSQGSMWHKNTRSTGTNQSEQTKANGKPTVTQVYERFPVLGKVRRFPALLTGRIFSRAWHKPQLSPRLALIAITGDMILLLDVIGS